MGAAVIGEIATNISIGDVLGEERTYIGEPIRGRFIRGNSGELVYHHHLLV
ncbi:hypothetical protein Thiowin_02990 [Thiorhodovibrio winogradskyi]|uniref:Uncharacterized protein n=1 Tax=Thiorhodovibrio winogradskyi TaxID=77007 RepID=A0ABZ0SBW2_9GAMM